MRSRRQRLLALGVLGAVAFGVVLAGAAIAGLSGSSIPTYTGCMTTNGGTVSALKEGNSPQKACPTGTRQVSFSGGDITKITVGSGLTGGGTEGDLTIGLNAQQSLPSCTTDQVAKWNGTAWACGADNDTTYSAGTGLDLSAANAFSLASAYRLPGKSCTTSGQFAKGFDSSGVIQCAAPAAVNLGNFDEAGLTGGIPAGDSPEFLHIASGLEGTYLLLARGTLVSSRDADDFSDVDCRIYQNDTVRDSTSIGSVTLDNNNTIAFSLMAVVTMFGGDELSYTCNATSGAHGVALDEGRLVGIRIGS